MVVREGFDLRLQNGESTLVLNEVLHELGTGNPDVVRVPIDCCEDIEQVLDI